MGEYEDAERQNQIERDLARFYARNPQTVAAPLINEPTGRSPLDMGTVSWDEVEEAVSFPKVGDMDFTGEVLPILRKRLVWDIVPHTTEIVGWQQKMAVNPGSEEGNVVEEADSDRRRVALLPLQPMVHIAAMAAGDIVSRAKALTADEDTEVNGTVMTLKPEHDVTAEVASGTLAVIANLLEMEILAYGKALTGE